MTGYQTKLPDAGVCFALCFSVVSLWAMLPDSVLFTNIIAQSGIAFRLQSSRTPQKYLLETMPGGVALFDYDGDGKLDIFFTNGAFLQSPMGAGAQPDKSAPQFWNRLYRNNGNNTFTDVTERAGLQGDGYSMGVAVADYDNDGHPDLYVTHFGHNTLYHNNGNGTFTDVTARAGIRASGWSASAAFLDYDRDGRLDLFVTRYLDWDFTKNVPCGAPAKGQAAYCHPDLFRSATYLLYHNNGDGTFTDASAKSGIAGAPGRGLGSVVADVDQDGWPDILVANDAVAQQFFHNNQNGTFTEMALPRGMAYDENGQAFSGMGIVAGDVDQDGWPDVFVDALANQKYALFHNRQGAFEYTSGPSGVAGISMAHSGWGAGFFDYDNDGWPDLFVAQSHVMDNIEYFQGNVRYLEPLLLLHNVRGRFVDVSKTSGAAFRTLQAARGAAFGDLDDDGQVDVVVSVLDGPPMLLHNGGSSHHWLTVDTVGTRSNRDGLGARLHLVSSSGHQQYATVTTSGSYLSASDKRVHFGLGDDGRVTLLEIAWPSGITQRLQNLEVDRAIVVREP